MKITNTTDIPLSLAVWLLHDDYDYKSDPTYISATSLMKPLQSIILGARVDSDEQLVPDLTDYISRALGHSLHDSIEKAWRTSYKNAFSSMGYGEDVINRILINPEKEAIQEDSLVVRIEERHFKKLEGFTIGGKYDMVFDGQVQDHKSTSAWGWVFGTRDEDFIMQGSIYRWLAPEIITEDTMQVNFIFTDWQKSMAARRKDYPQSRLQSKTLKLKSLKETEDWIKERLKLIKKYWDAPQGEIPHCTDEELWRSETVYKYFKDIDAQRATKNFDSMMEAQQYKATKGRGQGIIKTFPGEPKRCHYCPAFPICEQRKRMIPDE